VVAYLVSLVIRPRGLTEIK